MTKGYDFVTPNTAARKAIAYPNLKRTCLSKTTYYSVIDAEGFYPALEEEWNRAADIAEAELDF